MSDKPMAGVMTAIIITPILAVCCLGPVIFASTLGSVFAWFAGLDPFAVAAVALIVGGVGVAFAKRRRARIEIDDDSIDAGVSRREVRKRTRAT